MNFIWFFGTVEDRNDPANLNRCRVRCHGFHTPDKTLIPTEDLPWATPMLPLNSTTPIVVKEGDTVLGYFQDGRSAQQPMILGIVPGIPSTVPDINQGFSDPGTNLENRPVMPKEVKYSDSGEMPTIEDRPAARYPLESALVKPQTTGVNRGGDQTGDEKTTYQNPEDQRILSTQMGEKALIDGLNRLAAVSMKGSLIEGIGSLLARPITLPDDPNRTKGGQVGAAGLSESVSSLLDGSVFDSVLGEKITDLASSVFGIDNMLSTAFDGLSNLSKELGEISTVLNNLNAMAAKFGVTPPRDLTSLAKSITDLDFFLNSIGKLDVSSLSSVALGQITNTLSDVSDAKDGIVNTIKEMAGNLSSLQDVNKSIMSGLNTAILSNIDQIRNISTPINNFIGSMSTLGSMTSGLPSGDNRYHLPTEYKEPKHPVQPQYPYNKMNVTESGHVIGYDDTKGNEQLVFQHRSKSGMMFYPDGNMVTSISGERHSVVYSHDYHVVKGRQQVLIEGSQSVVVQGAQVVVIEGAAKIVHKGDVDMTVDGHYNVRAKGNMGFYSEGNMYARSESAMALTSKAAMDLKSKDTMKVQSDTGMSMKSGEGIKVEAAGGSVAMKASESMKMESSDGMQMKTGGAVAMTASTIHLNDTVEATGADNADDAFETPEGNFSGSEFESGTTETKMQTAVNSGGSFSGGSSGGKVVTNPESLYS